MKINIQIEGEEAASATTFQRTASTGILEKASDLGAEDAGPAPALIPGVGKEILFPSEENEQAIFFTVTAIDCGGAPEEFRSKAASEKQADATSTEPIEAEDAGKAVQQ